MCTRTTFSVKSHATSLVMMSSNYAEERQAEFFSVVNGSKVYLSRLSSWLNQITSYHFVSCYTCYIGQRYRVN